MKRWTILAVIGLLPLALIIFLQHDLRGWTPVARDDPATMVQPSQPGTKAFAVGKCLSGTISPWNQPTAAEYSGSATLTVMSCRSRSSAMKIGLAYLLIVAIGFGALRIFRGRIGSTR